MTSVFDVSSVKIDGRPTMNFDEVLTTIVVRDDTTPKTIKFLDRDPVKTIKVVTEGPQGPPGVKNVYVQPNDPAIEFGWGEAEKNYIWIPTEV